MLINLRKITSLKNLYQANLSGQVPTLLILVMVIILIFIITTVNLGRLSVTATTISNAADTTVLAIASALATRSHDAWVGLNTDNEHAWDVKRCQRTGWLGKILAAIGAVVSILAGQPQNAYACIYYGMIGGALGGALGEGLVQGTWKGALIGAGIGAGIGLSIAAGAQFVSGLAGQGVFSAGATSTATLTTEEGLVAAAFGQAAGLAAETIPIAASTYFAAIVGGILGGASSIYAEVSKEAAYDKSAAAVMETIGKINDDYARLREQALFQALSLVVDDPERVQDASDIDGDGDTDEKVNRFIYNYYTEYLPQVSVISLVDAIEALQESLKNFIDPQDNMGVRGFLRYTNRKEVECSVCDCPGVTCAEGHIIEFLRTLKECKDSAGQSKYNIPFWKPLPDRQGLLDWYDCSTGCPPPEGFDEVDFTRLEYERFIDLSNLIIERKPEELERNLEWMNAFFKLEESTNSHAFFDRLKDILEGNSSEGLIGIKGWKNELNTTVATLPRCQLVYGKFTPQLTGLNYGHNSQGQLVLQPCGPAYNPWPEEEALRNPFYPCVWKEVPMEEQTGPYFANYPCRISSLDRENNAFPPGLIQQLEAIKKAIYNNDAVNPGLQQKLEEKFWPEAETACASNCVGQSNCSCFMSDFDLKIDRLSLTNSDKQLPCYKGPINNTPSVLSYSYYYTYNCKKCCEVVVSDGGDSGTGDGGSGRSGSGTSQRGDGSGGGTGAGGSGRSGTSPGTSQRGDISGGGTGDGGSGRSGSGTSQKGDRSGGDSGGPTTVTETQCNSMCNPSPCREEGSGTLTLAKDVIDALVDVNVNANVTDIVEIPEVNGDDAIDQFFAKIEEIKNSVNSLSIIPPQPSLPLGMPFVTLDKDSDDEFKDPYNMINAQISKLANFLSDLDLLQKVIENAYGKTKPKDGYGKATYEWTDSLGKHTVTAQIGPFKLANIVERKYGNWLIGKKCWEMENYCENTPWCPRNANYTWVSITREDQADKDEISDKKNVLGKWLGFGKDRVTTTRSSAASYSYNRVGLARVKWLMYSSP